MDADALRDLAAKLRNLSRIMAGGDGTERIDTPAWKRAAEIADEIESLAPSKSTTKRQTVLAGVEVYDFDAAHEALESLDDFARMAEIIPHGPYAVIRDLITKAKGWKEQADAAKALPEKWRGGSPPLSATSTCLRTTPIRSPHSRQRQRLQWPPHTEAARVACRTNFCQTPPSGSAQRWEGRTMGEKKQPATKDEILACLADGWTLHVWDAFEPSAHLSKGQEHRKVHLNSLHSLIKAKKIVRLPRAEKDSWSMSRWGLPEPTP